MPIAMETASALVSAGSETDLTSEKPLDQHQQQTSQTQLSRGSTSPATSSPTVTEQPALQIDLGTNLSAILNATAKNSDTKNENSPAVGDDANLLLERELEIQQKAFQRFTSSLNDLGFRSTFPMNVFPPFLAAMQQNPLTLHNQFVATSGSNPRSSGVSPGLDDDDDNYALGNQKAVLVTEKFFSFRKEKKECGAGSGVGCAGDDNADSDASGQQNWSYEEQFKQVRFFCLF
ncbi:unnamed protein product [Gongylonema pulchrum]|uniref:Uncharacterized protein n=1 Tax=Gongylonema pulchrum TaxID=637853 RepID=A0A183D2L4_9BILA|nr:unnamed protein product [Gongylonema pulchrum]